VAMRKNLVVGILKERGFKGEQRAPLTPSDVSWLIKKGLRVEVESSKDRIFKDAQYKKAGARLVNKFKEASLLLGIKPPVLKGIYKNKIYMVFSHTIKGQPENRPLLKEFIRKGVTLIDYEKIVNLESERLVYFGRVAGICGVIDSLHYLGKKLAWQGMKNPFLDVKPAYGYNSFKEIVEGMSRLGYRIKGQGFDDKLSPFIIGLVGHGHVSQGVEEILGYLKAVEVHPKDIQKIIRQPRKQTKRKIYKIIFLREERIRSKDGHRFYFEEYLQHPERFESNLGVYLSYLNLLINASYWDSRYPRMVTKKMVSRLAAQKKFRLAFIGDISCDINGSIELTYKATRQEEPVFTYNPGRGQFVDGYKEDGISILAVDNLPTELPGDASREFSGLIRDYVYQIAAHGIKDITEHAAISREIRRAVITQNKKLTKPFAYLKKYLG